MAASILAHVACGASTGSWRRRQRRDVKAAGGRRHITEASAGRTPVASAVYALKRAGRFCARLSNAAPGRPSPPRLCVAPASLSPWRVQKNGAPWPGSVPKPVASHAIDGANRPASGKKEAFMKRRRPGPVISARRREARSRAIERAAIMSYGRAREWRHRYRSDICDE